MKRTFFFAMPADIVPVLKRFEANAPEQSPAQFDLKLPSVLA
jgi:hypothetical protein